MQKTDFHIENQAPPFIRAAAKNTSPVNATQPQAKERDAEAPHPKKTRKQTQPNDQDPELVYLPVKVETRQPTPTRIGEAYILRNSTKDKYVAGQTARQCSNYIENVDLLKGKLEAKELTTKTEAREYLASLVFTE